MVQSMRIRVGKRRTIVIPKHVTEKLGINKGSILQIEVSGESIILRPELTAIDIVLKEKSM